MLELELPGTSTKTKRQGKGASDRGSARSRGRYVPGISSSDSEIGKLLSDPPAEAGKTPGFSIPLRDLFCGLLIPKAKREPGWRRVDTQKIPRHQNTHVQ